MKRVLLLMAAILSVLPGIRDALAEQGGESIATVVAVRGQVVAISAAGATRTLAIKGPLYVEDSIKTGKQGRVQLLFKDATIISLAPATEMKLAEYKWDPEAKTGGMKTQVKEGTFRVMGGALTKFAPKNFTTETPTATIGIRGSMYAGSVQGNTLSVVFNGGKGIDIINAAGRVAITKPGFGTHVRGADQPPTPPRKFSAVEMGTFSESLTSTPKAEEENKAAAADEPAPAAEEPGAAPDAQEEQQETGEQAGTVAEGDASGAGESTSTQAATTEKTASSGTLTETGDAVAVESIPVTVAATTVQPTIQTTPIPTVADVYDPTANPANQPEATQTATVSTKPTDGISAYLGNFDGVGTVSTDRIFGDLLMVINWHSGKAFGLLEDQSAPSGLDYGAPAFFIGTISGSSMTDVHVFGSDAGDPNILNERLTSLVGTGTGSFLGADFDIFDAKASGEERNLTVPGTPRTGTWDVALSAVRQAQDKTAPRGSATWAGFAVGISENVNAPDIERKIFMNNMADAAAEHFTLAINKDTGTISGSLKAPQVNRVSGITYGAIDLAIGGAFGSAYIQDKGMAALIGCAGNCINDDSTATPGLNVTLTPYGNYLISEAPDYAFSDYVSWGFWEVSHQEADGADPDLVADIYHTHAPYSMWIAGQKTPSTFVANLIDHTTFVGHYDGMAQGTVIDSLNHAFEMTNGRSDLTVDFSRANVASAITGSLTFNEVTLGIDSAASMLSPYGFKAQITNAGAINSAVNGAFYGPGANAVGGNFQAEFSTRRYLGIFGGNLTNGPAR